MKKIKLSELKGTEEYDYIKHLEERIEDAEWVINKFILNIVIFGHRDRCCHLFLKLYKIFNYYTVGKTYPIV